MNIFSKGKNRITLALCSVAITGMLVAQAASADDKMLSGTSCQPNSGAAVSDFSYYSTGIQNNSTTTQWVTCSGVRDVYSGAVLSAGVNVAGTGTFSCYFDNVNNNGTLGGWKYASRTNTGYLTIVPSLFAAIPYTPYAFLCSLPTNSKLVSTYINEL